MSDAITFSLEVEADGWKVEKAEKTVFPTVNGYPADFQKRAADAKAAGHILTCILQIGVLTDETSPGHGFESFLKMAHASYADKKTPRYDILQVRCIEENSQVVFSAGDDDGEKIRLSSSTAILEIQAVFYVVGKQIVAQIGSNYFYCGNEPDALKCVQKRNEAFNVKTPPETLAWVSQHSLTKPKTPTIAPHPLHDSAALQVPNDPASVLFTRMITQPKMWQTNENECHKYAQDGKNKAVVIYRPDEEIPEYWSDFRERVLQSLEGRFASMKGELVADVADILFWHWLSNERPAYANITLAQVLEYRGVKPRPNTIEEHWQAMRDVRAIRLRGGGIESEALFHISAAQPNLWGTAEPPKLATVYRFHPGYFLSEAIQHDGFFLAYYARSVWQLDYYRDANAKKLARVLRADWRRNAENYLPTGKPRYRTWGALLADAGIDTESGDAQNEPSRFIRSIERELEKLYQNEFVRECATAIYHPDDQILRANLPPKGKLRAWLALRTHIAPAADITDALTHTATRRLARVEKIKALAETPKKPRKPRKKASEK